MYKLPFNQANRFREVSRAHQFRLASEPVKNEVQLSISGLIDPSSITVTLEYVDSVLCAVVQGTVLQQENYFTNQDHTGAGMLTYSVSRSALVPFTETVEVPLGVDPMPKATLTVCKDSCGNAADGVLKLEWAVLPPRPVEVEVKDCHESD